MVKHLNHKEPTMLTETSRKVLLVIVAALIFMDIIISCSGDVSKTPSSSVTQSTSSSVTGMKPSEVVTTAFMAANDGNFSEFEKYLSSSMIKDMKQSGDLSKAVVFFCLAISKNGTIKNIEVLKEEIQGEKAKIFFKIIYKDGTAENTNFPLIKESGQWKLIMP
jgi:hypothetical protein